MQSDSCSYHSHLVILTLQNHLQENVSTYFSIVNLSISNLSRDFIKKNVSNLWHWNFFLEGIYFYRKNLAHFSDSRGNTYLCLSNMKVLIVVVNDRIFRTTSSYETNALFPQKT